MQQSIVKFIALSYRHCSTCFGHYNAHHQDRHCNARNMLSIVCTTKQ